MLVEGTIAKQQLIDYLQSMLDGVKESEKRWGVNDPLTQSRIDSMIACRVMAEAIIGEPVNLLVTGKITVGFNE